MVNGCFELRISARLRLLFSWLAYLVLCLPGALASQSQIPDYTTPVTDGAGVLSAVFEAELGQRLEAIWQNGGPQFAVYTVVSLGDESIEQLSIRTAEKWKLGSKEKDDGVLIILAPNDREVRIEIGRGLEGDIPDAIAKRILNEDVIPRLKRLYYEDALRAAIVSMALRLKIDTADSWWNVTSGVIASLTESTQVNAESGQISFLGRIHKLLRSTVFSGMILLGIYDQGDALPQWLDFLCLLAMLPIAVAVPTGIFLFGSYLLSLLPGSSSSAGRSTGKRDTTPTGSRSSSSPSSSSQANSSSKGGGGSFGGGGASGKY